MKNTTCFYAEETEFQKDYGRTALKWQGWDFGNEMQSIPKSVFFLCPVLCVGDGMRVCSVASVVSDSV